MQLARHVHLGSIAGQQEKVTIPGLQSPLPFSLCVVFFFFFFFFFLEGFFLEALAKLEQIVYFVPVGLELT